MQTLKDLEVKKIFLGPVEVYSDPKIINLCKNPYYGHPKGCPNLNKRFDCPPKSIYYPKSFEKNAYITAVGLNFRQYVLMMKERHSNWSQRALKNPLYWQGYLRKNLREYLEEVHLKVPDGYTIVINPEASGVNLTLTCRKAGLNLEWPPENYVYKVALIAKKII